VKGKDGSTGVTIIGDEGASLGLMQINEKEFVANELWSDPEQNISKGADVYLNKLTFVPEWIKNMDDRYRLAASFYNTGQSRARLLPQQGASTAALEEAIEAVDAKTTSHYFDGMPVPYGRSIMERARWFHDQGVR
jgi:hypothetical protein